MARSAPSTSEILIVIMVDGMLCESRALRDSNLNDARVNCIPITESAYPRDHL